MKRVSKFGRSDADGGDEEDANWQDSYSDLMTDLLAIFVVLFSFAMMSQAVAASKTSSGQKSEDVAEVSIMEQIVPGGESVLVGQDGANGQDSADGQDSANSQNSANGLVESLETYIDEADLSEEMSVSKQGNNQILLRVASSVLFDSGQADIHPSAEPMIDRLSDILTENAESIKMVRIEGHTDNIPISNNQFDSNWELSMSRAASVVKRCIELSQLGPEKFSAVGYSEYHPIADNDTGDGRTLNRRVDIIIETKSE